MTITRKASVVDVNRNVDWLNSPATWTWYILIILISWLGITGVIDDAGMSWTYVHLIHGVITYYLLHWSKGTSVKEDFGKFDSLTFWEQLDNRSYGTRNRKLFTVMPLVLFTLATHGTDFKKQPLGLNLIVVMVLLIAKLPILHKVRFFGINKY
mmetsp:Transcript_11551/g.20825  ORF Transcript_11551/g.20825 Transcript_11551/m.20825 type:complete len:154 (-) Transcript_11551:1277-1738(-)